MNIMLVILLKNGTILYESFKLKIYSLKCSRVTFLNSFAFVERGFSFLYFLF